MRFSALPKPVLITAAALCGSVTAHAHPHMWVEMRSYVVFDANGLITAIDLEWTFDDAYARMALEGLDTNGDGVYSQTELEPLTTGNMASLKDYNYFVVPRVNGEIAGVKEPLEYGHIYSNDKLTLHFNLPLTNPVDPRKSEFLYKVYDPEFFIAMEYASIDSVGVVGTLPKGCALKLVQSTDDKQAQQIKEMLATKGKDWKPPANEDFGGLFAQPTLVLCAS